MTTHTVQSGDTLSAIAARYGVSVADIVAANDIADPDLIFPGQTFTIPTVEPDIPDAPSELMCSIAEEFPLSPAHEAIQRCQAASVNESNLVPDPALFETQLANVLARQPLVMASSQDNNENLCTDDTGTECKCGEMSQVTLYVQSRRSPPAIVVQAIRLKMLGKGRVDSGHTFIGLGKGGLADQEAYGFYPKKDWFGSTGAITTNEGVYLPGQIEPNTTIYIPENEHPFTSSRSFQACPETVRKIRESIQADIERIRNDADDAPQYDIYNLQCTTWAIGKLRDAGFDFTRALSPWGADVQVNLRNSVDALFDL